MLTHAWVRACVHTHTQTHKHTHTHLPREALALHALATAGPFDPHVPLPGGAPSSLASVEVLQQVCVRVHVHTCVLPCDHNPAIAYN